ncbi:MAG: nucleotidyl transferase AbiEii/AbiGii toxin family protein [Promethearchaeota archaeon]|jgi:predicted nucleotidyltransferase component of viral defense system
MDWKFLEEINKLAIQALGSDDELFDRLFLKGGNALELIYKIADRASIDLDFSITDSFDDENLQTLEEKVNKLLIDTFKEKDYSIYDLKLKKRPAIMNPKLEPFWGGYTIEFKVISSRLYEKYKNDIDSLRRNAIPLSPNNSTILRIEISKYEYCPSYEQKDIEGFTINVYSPTMIAIEKLRAICQQMEEYKEIVSSATRTPRARDFFDIYTIANTCGIDLLNADNRRLIEEVFDAKKVPIQYLKNLEKYREYHKIDFVAVQDTVKPGVKLHDYDFYFDYVKSICDKL